MKGSRKEKGPKEEKSLKHTIGNIIGIVLCIILIPVLCVNITLLVKSWTNSDEVPSIGGWMPLIILTDSMYPNIQSGDLILCQSADPSTISVGDTISFFDPDGNGTSVVTHQVTEITEQDGELAFQTKGIANNTEDASLVPASALVGVYKHRIAGAGNIAMFMQTTQGLILCVVVPLVLLVGYDLIRRRAFEKKNAQDTEALLEELARLRAEKGQEA